MHEPHADIAGTAALLADRSRVAMLLALEGGRALPAGELARAARIGAASSRAFRVNGSRPGLVPGAPGLGARRVSGVQPWAAAGASAPGNTTRKVLPAPSWLSTSMRPPIPSTSSRVMYSPSPSPSGRRSPLAR